MEKKEKKLKQTKENEARKNITKGLKKIDQKFEAETGEDATKYGEFVCSYFAWVTPEEQKKTVEKMEKISNIKEQEHNM